VAWEEKMVVTASQEVLPALNVAGVTVLGGDLWKVDSAASRLVMRAGSASRETILT
jgi:hypothetical protein